VQARGEALLKALPPCASVFLGFLPSLWQPRLGGGHRCLFHLQCPVLVLVPPPPPLQEGVIIVLWGGGSDKGRSMPQLWLIDFTELLLESTWERDMVWMEKKNYGGK
jgi:hypothetical protein